MSDKPKLKKIIGLRNIVTDGKKWRYLLFYDLDNPTEKQIIKLKYILNEVEMSYIIYKTKHGIHLVGLSPLTIWRYALLFTKIQAWLPEYYSGQTIRLSRKEGEKQELIDYNLDYPVIWNLIKIYVKRFPELIKYHDFDKVKGLDNWRLVFEKFWSSKV